MPGIPFEVSVAGAKILAYSRAELVKHLSADVDPRAEALLDVVLGHPGRMLVDRAESLSADLVVLGPHEKRGLFDFGSTARLVLSKAPCNVWMQAGEYRPVKNILVPLDLSEDSLRALRMACSLAQRLDAKITTLHCYQPPDFAYGASGYPVVEPSYVVEGARDAAEKGYREDMAKFDWAGVEHEERFFQGRPVEVILEHHTGCDLIAMGSHGRSGVSAAVLGNVAYGVMKKADVPVLAIRHPERRWLLSE
jgi:nucleotide-binding universal stress UspA family protein